MRSIGRLTHKSCCRATHIDLFVVCLSNAPRETAAIGCYFNTAVAQRPRQTLSPPLIGYIKTRYVS